MYYKISYSRQTIIGFGHLLNNMLYSFEFLETFEYRICKSFIKKEEEKKQKAIQEIKERVGCIKTARARCEPPLRRRLTVPRYAYTADTYKQHKLQRWRRRRRRRWRRRRRIPRRKVPPTKPSSATSMTLFAQQHN